MGTRKLSLKEIPGVIGNKIIIIMFFVSSQFTKLDKQERKKSLNGSFSSSVYCLTLPDLNINPSIFIICCYLIYAKNIMHQTYAITSHRSNFKIRQNTFLILHKQHKYVSFYFKDMP